MRGNIVRTRIVAGVVAAVAGLALSGCTVEGNVIDRRDPPGDQAEVRVKDGVDVESAVWVSIDDVDYEACGIGAQYPQCTKTQ